MGKLQDFKGLFFPKQYFLIDVKYLLTFKDEDIGNFQGWEVVVRRLKDGRQVLKEYAEFLKQR